MDQAEELNQAEDNAQTALAQRKLFQERNSTLEGPGVVELTKYYKKLFLKNSSTSDRGREFTITFDYRTGSCSAW